MVDSLPQNNIDRDQAAKIMARLNALFPPNFKACEKDEDEVEPSSDIVNLRGEIRLCIYEHLMRPTKMLQDNEQSFKVNFTSPCSIPSYEICRNSMVKYAEEFQKFEELCFIIFRQIEEARDDSPPTWLKVPLRNGSEIHGIVQTAYCSWNTIAVKTSTVARTSSNSRPTSSPTLTGPIASQNTNPLLEDMPGHELSAAKKDVAAFSLDSPTPDDLDCSEFHIHPLFQDQKSVSDEMKRPGVILVKKRSSRNF